MAVGGGFSITTGGKRVTAASPGLGTLIFRMEVSGFEPVAISLAQWGERLKDFRPFWIDYFAPSFYRNLQRNFELEGSYVGGWAPLSPGYAAWKQAHYPGKTILRRTDALFRSLSFENGHVGPRGIFLPGERALVLGTSVDYAQFHQTPGSFRSRGLLRVLRQGIARRFLFLPKRGSTFGRLLQAFAHEQADIAGIRVAKARATPSSGLL